ncbi:LPXTG cell wall anchor domain-containing protein, partial [Streptococcus agalactiae]|nr:LPXTG cell wall anchor domain-containing protein [Streptococcus agalactiae]
VVNDSFTSQDKVDDAVKIITDSIVALRVSAAEEAVKAAEDAAQAGKDKKAEVEADGVVELPSTGEINTHLSLFGIIVLLISTLMYGSKKKED